MKGSAGLGSTWGFTLPRGHGCPNPRDPVEKEPNMGVVSKVKEVVKAFPKTTAAIVVGAIVLGILVYAGADVVSFVAE